MWIYSFLRTVCQDTTKVKFFLLFDTSSLSRLLEAISHPLFFAALRKRAAPPEPPPSKTSVWSSSSGFVHVLDFVFFVFLFFHGNSSVKLLFRHWLALNSTAFHYWLSLMNMILSLSLGSDSSLTCSNSSLALLLLELLVRVLVNPSTGIPYNPCPSLLLIVAAVELFIV